MGLLEYTHIESDQKPKIVFFFFRWKSQRDKRDDGKISFDRRKDVKSSLFEKSIKNRGVFLFGEPERSHPKKRKIMIWFPISIFILRVSSSFFCNIFFFLLFFSPFRTKVAPCHPIRQPKPVNIIYAVVFIYVKCQQDCKLKRRLYRSSGPVCVSFPPWQPIDFPLV